jgi:hypothetical protein
VSNLKAVLTLEDVTIPGSGVVVAQYQIMMAETSNAIPAQTQTVSPDVTEVVFEGVPPGTYLFTAQAVDIHGDPVGPPATVTYALTEVTTVKIPTSITVSPT